jgi:predicted ATPase
VAKAQMLFDCALSVARQQQAKSWELRAAMRMARLWRDQGKRDEASICSRAVCGWFTERFDTFDLKEAKALLDKRRHDGLLILYVAVSSQVLCTPEARKKFG